MTSFVNNLNNSRGSYAQRRLHSEIIWEASRAARRGDDAVGAKLLMAAVILAIGTALIGELGGLGR